MDSIAKERAKMAAEVSSCLRSFLVFSDIAILQ